MARLFLILPPVLFLTLAAMFWFGMNRANPDEMRSALVGRAAPAVPTEILAGYPGLSDGDLRAGKVTLVNFWASWCPPCRAEHPVLMALAARGIPVAGINMLDNPANAAAYLAKEGNPFFGVAVDRKGRNRLEWGVTAPPETFIIGPDGTVLMRFQGPLVGSDYEQRFLPELEKALAGG